jgi:hypothetical protein
MQDVLRRIQELRERTYRQIGYDEPSRPGPPASAQQLVSVEEKYHLVLPSSYSLFLSIHNGWEHWSGDVVLLSTEQMLVGEYHDRIEEWRGKQEPHSREWLQHCFVVGFSLFVGEQILIDYSEDFKGELVVWDHRVVERFPDFYDYLIDFEGTLKEELVDS